MLHAGTFRDVIGEKFAIETVITCYQAKKDARIKKTLTIVL